MKLTALHEAGYWQVLGAPYALKGQKKKSKQREMSFLKQPSDRDRFLGWSRGKKLSESTEEFKRLIVQLTPVSGSSPAEMRAKFEQLAAPVEQKITALGGLVLDKVWLNQTLLIKVPLANAAAIESAFNTSTPQKIHPDV